MTTDITKDGYVSHNQEGNQKLMMGVDLSSTITVETAIAKRKPLYAVFCDSSFACDDVMVSFDQIFATFSPTTERRVI